MRQLITIITGAAAAIAATISGTDARTEFDSDHIRARACGYAAYATLMPVVVLDEEVGPEVDPVVPVEPATPDAGELSKVVSPLTELMASLRTAKQPPDTEVNPKPDELSNERIIEIYAANKTSIDEIWTADEGRTLREATEIWLIESESKPSEPVEESSETATPVSWSWTLPSEGNWEPRYDAEKRRYWYKRIEKPAFRSVPARQIFRWGNSSCANGRCYRR